MEPTQPLAAEIELLKKAYAALNRNDIPGFVASFDPQIERIEQIEVPEIYQGLEAVKAHVLKGRGTWAEGGCEPEHFIVAPSVGGSERIVVLVRVRVRLKHETEWREGRTADVYTFRNGRVIQFCTFVDQRQAFEWVGVKVTG